MPHTILLIAPSPTAEPLAQALRRDLDAPVEIVANRRAGLAALRRAEYSLVLMEESLAGDNADALELLYQNAGAAPVVEANFAIAGLQRLVRQARAALARRAHDQREARTAAASALQSELNGSLTSLLLQSQLALREAQPAQAQKLRHVVELAGDLRNRLRAAG
jgi:signal transduction histidine kinase